MAAGAVSVILGGGLLGSAAVWGAIGPTAGTTLSLNTTAAGASCNNSNPQAPVCKGLAGGDVVAVSGTGFTPGSTASIVQCNSDPSQPVVVFLSNSIPISCSPLSLTSIGTSGAKKGTLAGN
ncbi:MAG TPA: neocarzinostatin apoprotein domain-containing protein, partial [Acidimicrobiales bacterium]|nr:neocarzinostatin apoprotein domain-containing protein [Acidimicrobiales bacterium]